MARALVIDSACAQAVDLAVAMAREVAESPDHVGEHLGAIAVEDRVAVHRFACLHPGYVGWDWCVAVARADAEVTVDEAWLEPAASAVLAPEWRPWSDRVRPGDLGAGDVFPTKADDPRLTAGFTAEDDLEPDDETLRPAQWEIGIGRERVLSAVGREDAVERWLAGEGGPDSAVAKAASLRCTTCGWLLPIGGPLGQAFGVCAQPMSPSDGRVVSFDHGCGAHSEVVVEPSRPEVAEAILDEVRFEAVDIADVADEPEASEGADVADEPEASEGADVADEPEASEGADIEPVEAIESAQDPDEAPDVL